MVGVIDLENVLQCPGSLVSRGFYLMDWDWLDGNRSMNRVILVAGT